TKILRLKALSKEWEYLPSTEKLNEIFEKYKPKLLLLTSPDNPTGQVPKEDFLKSAMEICIDSKAYLAIDFAYKTQTFIDKPSYYSWSPLEYENFISINSNSKWVRGLGRRMGWIEANENLIEGVERTQQCTILCPDTLHQLATTNFLNKTLENGKLKEYLEKTREEYRKTAELTIKAIDKFLGFRRLVPQGGLYTVADVETDCKKFVLGALKNTGVLFVPGIGFGKTLKNAIRISYGPLVREKEKIEIGMEKVAKWIKR
ncbi:MAG: pyridoxal phosphate-dependent aminotransferase, partial [Candidatus Thermoplasmatota archaeon]